MDTLQCQKLACELIKNDWLNHRLISGLTLLEVDASRYYLTLYECIFKLLGLERNDELIERYFALLNVPRKVELSDEKALEELAREMYNGLLNDSENLR